MAVGAASFTGLLVGFALWELALGRLAVARLPGDPQGVRDMAGLAVVHFAVLAYLVAAWVHAQRVSERNQRELLARCVPGAETDAILDASGDARWLRLAGLVGLCVSVYSSLTGPGEVSFDPRGWSAEEPWHRLPALLMGILLLRLIALLWIRSVRLSRLARRLEEVDLLDPAVFAPLVRQGLANAALVLGYVAAMALFLVSLAFLPMLLGSLAVGASAATVGLLIPLGGAHRSIRAARQAELAWCRRRIHEARGALERGEASRIDELLAWEARIEAVREWPIDASALRRFGLYLLLPLLSWSGAAVVERIIDQLLDR